MHSVTVCHKYYVCIYEWGMSNICLTLFTPVDRQLRVGILINVRIFTC